MASNNAEIIKEFADRLTIREAQEMATATPFSGPPGGGLMARLSRTANASGRSLEGVMAAVLVIKPEVSARISKAYGVRRIAR